VPVPPSTVEVDLGAAEDGTGFVITNAGPDAEWIGMNAAAYTIKDAARIPESEVQGYPDRGRPGDGLADRIHSARMRRVPAAARRIAPSCGLPRRTSAEQEDGRVEVQLALARRRGSTSPG
jgi:hypothetical protein